MTAELTVMRVIEFAAFGSAEVLRAGTRPVPAPGAGEIRVRVASVAVNPADTKWRIGMFEAIAPLTLPHVPGYDVAGIVDALSEGVTGWAIGDRIFGAVDPSLGGGYAEYALIAAAGAARIPDAMSFDVAATLPTAGLTGVQLIEEHVRPRPGETVLITGATGAVGRFALFAAQEMGVRVVAAVRRSQIAEAKALAATDIAVLEDDASEAPWFDRVADTIGGMVIAGLCRRLKEGGTIHTVATTPIPREGLATVPVFIAVHPDGDRLSRIAAAVSEGRLAAPIDRVLPLERVAEAHRLVEAGGLRGKIVLRV